MPFQAIKTRSSKSRKIEVFPKGITHGFGPNMVIFATFFCKAILVRKMSFRIFQNEKTPFQAIKRRSLRIRKIDTRVNPRFGPSMAIFPTFFFQALQVRKMTFSIFQIEKTPFQAVKTRSSKSRKMYIFPKGLTHGFWSQYGHFSNSFFQATLVRKMTFTIFQNKKTPFQAIKIRSSKWQKIEDFPKGLAHGFGPDMAFFPTFFLKTILVRKMSFTVFQNEKTPFQAIKTRPLKS